MKKISAILVALIGVVCIVFGVMFIMQAGDSRQVVADELAPIKISDVNATYDQVKAGLKANTDPTKAVSLTLQKLSLGSAKTNISTISFVEKTGMVVIIVGVGFALAGLGLLKKD
jgi:hypothetical protein